MHAVWCTTKKKKEKKKKAKDACNHSYQFSRSVARLRPFSHGSLCSSLSSCPLVFFVRLHVSFCFDLFFCLDPNIVYHLTLTLRWPNQWRILPPQIVCSNFKERHLARNAWSSVASFVWEVSRSVNIGQKCMKRNNNSGCAIILSMANGLSRVSDGEDGTFSAASVILRT